MKATMVGCIYFIFLSDVGFILVLWVCDGVILVLWVCDGVILVLLVDAGLELALLPVVSFIS